MIIYGAGMAGLLAGNVMRRFNPVIYEAQDSLPNNHAALLRFRSDIAAVATNIPFKKVNVQKMIDCMGEITTVPNMKYSNMYSEKVTGKIMGRSIMNLDPVERYIAPPMFISQMAQGLNIEYNQPLGEHTLGACKSGKIKSPIISTVPMPIMMDLVDWPDKPEFDYKPIWSVWGKIKSPSVDVYQTVYYPHKDDPFYRISITGDEFIAEYIDEPSDRYEEELWSCCEQSFGFTPEFESLEVKHQKFGKLLPIDDRLRKEFIVHLTDVYGVYSLGRFATWRQILLDDIVRDLAVIEQMLENDGNYGRKLIANGVKR